MRSSHHPSLPATIPEAFDRAARSFTTRRLELIDSRGRSRGETDWAALERRLHLAGHRMRGLGVRPGDRVVVCLGTSWEWFDAWFGALFAGGLPVSIAPPGGLGSPRAQIEKSLRVADRLEARLLVVAPNFSSELEGSGDLELQNGLPVLVTPQQLARATATVGELPGLSARPDDIAFLQLTSGSTGFPRAVQIPHRAAIHNVWASNLAIGRAGQAPANQWIDTMVSWLPLYHDMGLVGTVFFSLINGLNLRLLSPRSFLARPHVWLETIARSGTVLSLAPNFGYQMCVERIDARRIEGLDLSGWRSLLTGSEMVRAETMQGFFDLLAANAPLSERAGPCYGMAEATLAVSFDTERPGIHTRRIPAGADTGLGLQEVVSSGSAIEDTEVGVFGADGRRLTADRVGEVRVRGPGVFSGYWNDPEATAETLVDGWLHTGDLGFLDGEGELYLTGRLKEILILRGQNLMPHELEWVAEDVICGGGAQRSAAFSVAVRGQEAQGEQAVLVLECDQLNGDSMSELEREVRSRIGRTLSISLADLMLVKRGSLPRTSSGKIRRRETRELYLRGDLTSLSPRSESAQEV